MQLIYEQSIYDVNKHIGANNKRGVKADELQSVLINIVNSNGMLAYSTKRVYVEGCICIYDNAICMANQDTSGEFNISHWDQVNL